MDEEPYGQQIASDWQGEQFAASQYGVGNYLDKNIKIIVLYVGKN